MTRRAGSGAGRPPSLRDPNRGRVRDRPHSRRRRRVQGHEPRVETQPDQCREVRHDDRRSGLTLAVECRRVNKFGRRPMALPIRGYRERAGRISVEKGPESGRCMPADGQVGTFSCGRRVPRAEGMLEGEGELSFMRLFGNSIATYRQAVHDKQLRLHVDRLHLRVR